MDTDESPLGVLLTYDGAVTAPSSGPVILREAKPVAKVRFGLIGAGSHVKDALLPSIKKISDAEVVSVCTQRGINAQALAKRLGAGRCTTDFRDVLADAVFAATPEDVLISAALACEDEAAFRAAIEASPRESEPSARLTLPERSVCSIVG